MTDLATFAGRRIQGTFDVDPWGLDVDLVQLVAPLASLRWHISVDGEEHIPDDGPVLLVAPRRLLAPTTEAAVIASAVLRATGRVVRVLGIPDVAPVGPLLRRFGGAVGHPAEAAALLRAGNVVLARRVLETDAPVLAVHSSGWDPGRRWRVRFEPLR